MISGCVLLISVALVAFGHHTSKPDDVITALLNETFCNNVALQIPGIQFGCIGCLGRKLNATTAGDYDLLHGYITAQGPNYALAKTLQNWRCILARNS
eukprot:2900321-Amphidinium_carterae.1